MAEMNGYFFSYQKTASSILSLYNGREPFALYIKKFFKQQSKYGSRDRKIISDLCFGYFRMGKSSESYSIEERIQVGFYLTHTADNGYLNSFQPEWVFSINSSMADKFKFLESVLPKFKSSLIFPFDTPLSEGLAINNFKYSHLQKPFIFIRVRPGRKIKVVEVLTNANIEFDECYENCFRIKSNANIETLLETNRDYVVQDLSSQKTSEILPTMDSGAFQVWDACAASGGKAIMLHDFYPSSQLYVSDLRETILGTLKDRLKQAGIRASNIFMADLENIHTVPEVIKKNIPKNGVQLILADVPCTGSGTWGRSPEWLRFFNEKDLLTFQNKQINIVRSLIPSLKTGGHFIYITCSVFEAENEKVVEAIVGSSKLALVEKRLFAGFEEGADQLFAALFTLKA